MQFRGDWLALRSTRSMDTDTVHVLQVRLQKQNPRPSLSLPVTQLTLAHSRSYCIVLYLIPYNSFFYIEPCPAPRSRCRCSLRCRVSRVWYASYTSRFQRL